jgi:hypothetical protein
LTTVALYYAELLHDWHKLVFEDPNMVDILISDSELENFTLNEGNCEEILSLTLGGNAEITDTDKENFSDIFRELQKSIDEFEKLLHPTNENDRFIKFARLCMKLKEDEQFPAKMSLKYMECIYVMFLNEEKCGLSDRLAHVAEKLFCGKENRQKLKAKVAYVMCKELLKEKYSFEEFPEWQDDIYKNIADRNEYFSSPQDFGNENGLNGRNLVRLNKLRCVPKKFHLN